MIRNLKISLAIENVLLIFALLLANRRALVFQDFYLKKPFTAGHLWIELIFWFLLFGWMFYSITRKKGWISYAKAWKDNWFLIPFLSLAALSLLWTIHVEASLYRVIVLILSVFIAANIGILVGRDRFLTITAWCGVILILSSYLLIFTLPNIGKMMGHPYYGAWRGVFWHRNYLSTIMAFFAFLYLLQLIKYWKRAWVKMVFYGVLYLTSLPLVLLSRSLTGVALLLGLHGLVALLALWQHFRKSFRQIHYQLLGIVFLVGILIGFFRIEQIIDFLNKSASWSGRLVLWKYLLTNLVLERPLFGYGYGAIWNFHDFRVNLGQTINWTMPVLIGDNGYLDILLHLGIIGLILFLSILLIASIRFLSGGIAGGSVSAFFPFLLVVFLIVANISFSLFLELETFYWIVLVALLINRSCIFQDSTSMEDP